MQSERDRSPVAAARNLSGAGKSKGLVETMTVEHNFTPANQLPTQTPPDFDAANIE
jgi:hypothetical protein